MTRVLRLLRTPLVIAGNVAAAGPSCVAHRRGSFRRGSFQHGQNTPVPRRQGWNAAASSGRPAGYACPRLAAWKECRASARRSQDACPPPVGMERCGVVCTSGGIRVSPGGGVERTPSQRSAIPGRLSPAGGGGSAGAEPGVDFLFPRFSSRCPNSCTGCLRPVGARVVNARVRILVLRFPNITGGTGCS
jgi:hypothetical protein